MRYIMSDLHGCFDEFKKMLELIHFSEDDELYIIGDIIDRGPEPIPLLQYIMNQKNIHVIMGNHEDMMINAIKSRSYDLWFYNGGEITNKQFKKLKSKKQNEILSYLSSLPLMKELSISGEDYILLHGGPGLFFKVDYEANKITKDVLWERFDSLNKEEAEAIFPGKNFIVGHTPTFMYGKDNKIISCGNIMIIDCGCVFGYSLSCLCLEKGKVYYVKSKLKSNI